MNENTHNIDSNLSQSMIFFRVLNEIQHCGIPDLLMLYDFGIKCTNFTSNEIYFPHF